MRRLLRLLRLIPRTRKPIEGSQTDHLYPAPTKKAMPREMSEQERTVRDMVKFQANVEILNRRGSSTAAYMTESEATTLVIAQRKKL